MNTIPLPRSNVDRGLALLEALAQHATGAALGALAEELGAPKSAVHRALQSLIERGYVVQDPDSQEYSLSLKLALLGFRMLDAGRLPDVAQTVLDLLARDTGEYCRIALAEQGTLTWVASAQGATAGLRYDPPMGRDVVLHATATGKAWLAAMPEEEALALVYRRGLAVPPGFGSRVVRTVDALREHLAMARRRGYALAVDEGEPGITAVALAFRGFEGAHAPVVGTLSVAGPSARVDAARVKRIVVQLRRAATELTAIWPVRVRQRRRAAPVAHEARVRGGAKP